MIQLPGKVLADGFHRIEADLWLAAAQANYPGEFEALDPAGRQEVGSKLVADVTELYDLVYADDF